MTDAKSLMLSVVMLSEIMLSVVAPPFCTTDVNRCFHLARNLCISRCLWYDILTDYFIIFKEASITPDNDTVLNGVQQKNI